MMKNPISSQPNIELLISKINHAMVLIRKKELTQYDIAPRQLYVLHIIHALGAMATASTVAWEVDREVHVINKLVINLERAGLIKRIKNSPKSQLLRLELTDKGIDMLKVSQKCTTIEEILSFLLTEESQHLESVLNNILTRLNECNLNDRANSLAGIHREI
jgi:DNA-binding MarR family transcriptional regulator